MSGVEAGAGPFRSSQKKPSLPARATLPALARDAARLKVQQSYFAALKSGVDADKAALLGAVGATVQAGVRDLRAGALVLRGLALEAGQSMLVETRTLSPGADPVLHLVSVEDNQEVAFDDDSGSEAGAARFRFEAPRRGAYVLLLRAYRAADDGTCDLWIDGRAVAVQAKFGGTEVSVASKRRLHLVLLDDGQGSEPWPPSGRASRDPVLLLLDPESGRLLDLDDDSGVELGPQLTVGQVPALALVGALGASEEGAVRLVVNDLTLGDSDGDGLGDGLERSLCTCATTIDSACGFECGRATTAQDSDGDGLSDSEEVLGLDHAQMPQLFPRWGADPRHKDLFVEVDLADWTDTTKTPPERHFGRAPTGQEAQLAARVFGRLTSMDNPDGKDGVRLHLDTGQVCGSRASGIDETCGPLCAYGQDGVRRCGPSSYAGGDKRAGLAPGRRNRFHLAVSDCLVAGSAPVLQDTLEFDCDRITAMVHELGHNLGLERHYGTLQTGGGNCKPNYPSLMNYAYSDRFAGGREVRFSDGALVGPGDLDPLDLDETTPFGGSKAEVSWLATRPFYYDLHDCQDSGVGCKVDWNRDGRLDPSVRAHISPMPNYGYICENIHGNALDSENLEGLTVRGGVAAAERSREQSDGTLAPALHVIAPVDGARGRGLAMAFTFAAQGQWSGFSQLPTPTLASDAQPAAETVGYGETQRLWFCACREGSAPILCGTLDARGLASTLEAVPGQPAGLSAREVSLAARGSELLLVVRDDRDGQVYATAHGASGWNSAFSALMAEGGPLRSTVAPALTAAPGNRVFLVTGDPAPLTGPVGRLHLYSHGPGPLTDLTDEELHGLRFEDGLPDKEHVLWSRPALRFVPHLDGKGQPLPDERGYLALWWLRERRTRYLWTWGVLDRRQARFSLGRWHHYEAFGYTDAVAGAGPALVLRDGNRLGALLAQSDLFVGLVRHVPHADGLPGSSVVFRDHDDRPRLRGSLCASLNWDCEARCQKLSDGCTQPMSGLLPATEVSCQLPRLSDEEAP